MQSIKQKSPLFIFLSLLFIVCSTSCSKGYDLVSGYASAEDISSIGEEFIDSNLELLSESACCD